jgi:hypothetical protein
MQAMSSAELDLIVKDIGNRRGSTYSNLNQSDVMTGKIASLNISNSNVENVEDF